MKKLTVTKLKIQKPKAAAGAAPDMAMREP